MKLRHRAMPFVFIMQGIGAWQAFGQSSTIVGVAFLITCFVSFLVMCPD